MIQPAGKRHIEQTPAVCGGKPHIAGTRIRVIDVYVWHELQGQTPDEIVSNHPELSLANVYAALAYYWDNRDAIQEQVAADREYIDGLRSASSSKLLRRIAGMDADDADQVSP